MIRMIQKKHLPAAISLFLTGVLILWGFQIHWLQSHPQHHVVLRLIVAPVFSGLFFLLLGLCLQRYNRWSTILEHLSLLQWFVSAKNKISLRESAFVSILIIAVLALAFCNVIFMGRTLQTSSMVPGTTPSGPYKYDKPNGHWPVIDGGATPWQIEPWAAKIREEALQKHWPLWNPNSGVGVPLLANMQSAPFSPFRLIVHLAGSPRAWDLYFLSRLFVAGLFTYLFLRLWNLSVISSFSGSIVFMLCGYNILFINMGHLDVDVMVPALLYAFERLFRNARRLNIIFAAILVCFSFLGGMPESAFFALFLTTLYYAFRTITQGVTGRLGLPFYMRKLSLFILISLAGALLAAPQLFPFLEYLKNAWTGHSTSSGLLSNPLIGGISLIIPYFFGNPQENWNGLSSFFLGAYIGTLPLFLSFIAIFSHRVQEHKHLTYFFSAFCLFFVLKYFGFFIINWVGCLPIFNKMLFAKYCIPDFSFSIAVLSAIGIESLCKRASSSRIISLSFFSVLSVLFVYLAVQPLSLFPELQQPTILHYVSVQIATSLSVLLLGYYLCLSIFENHSELSVVLLGVLLLTELIIYIPQDRPYRYNAATLPPFVSKLKEDPDRFRVLGMDGFFYPNSSSYFNIDCITDLDAMYPSGYIPFMHEFISPKVQDRFTGTELSSDFDPIIRYLNLMNVKYIVTSRNLGGMISNILNDSKIVPENRIGINTETFLINGISKQVLFQHPPSTITYPLSVPANGVLSFSIAMSPLCWSPEKGDGVEFSISIRDGGKTYSIFDAQIDPKNNPKDRRWHDYSISLAKFGGRTVDLILQTGFLSNPDSDWAGWGDLKISPKTETVELSPIYDADAKIYLNPGAMPRAYIVPDAVFANNEKDALAMLRNPKLNLRQSVVLENANTMSMNLLSRRQDAVWNSQAKINNYSPNGVSILTTQTASGFLVLSDQYYPGWKAYVDGRESEIIKANYLFRAIYLSAGPHQVEFLYTPSSFVWGCICCLISVVGIALYCFTR
jgi:hypothetical protein